MLSPPAWHHWRRTHRRLAGSRWDELGRWLRESFQGRLSLAWGSSTLRDEDFLIDGSFRQAWSRLDDAMEQARLNPFAGLSHDEQVAIFQPRSQPSLPLPLALTLDASLETLGGLLHQADYLLLHHLDPTLAPPARSAEPTWQTIARPLGMHLQVCGPHAPLDHTDNCPPDPSDRVLWTTALALHDEALEKLPPPLDRPMVCQFRPIRTIAPTMKTNEDLQAWQRLRLHPKVEPHPQPGQAKDFALLAEQSRGIKRLGVLRLRLNDLERWLREGIDGGKLVHAVALGGAFLDFLSGRASQSCAGDSSTVERLFYLPITHDRLDIIGSWNLLPDLAYRISSDLATYTGGAPSFGLAAGISLHEPLSPLRLAVEAASSELERASTHPDGAALGWLNQVTTWDNVSDLLALKQELYEAVRRGTAPADLLSLCQHLYQNYRQTPQGGHLFYGPWLWRGEYHLAQMMEARRSARPLIGRIRQRLRDGVMREGTLTPASEGTRYIERLGLAARWAGLELRKEQ
ncbi:MAG: hypothetical protein HC884_15145 [Chloroflexaceae bacterium]|nr:hypothetical protein [Chloroflexaceae bacterium]